MWCELELHASSKYLLRHTSAAVFDQLVNQAYFARECVRNRAAAPAPSSTSSSGENADAHDDQQMHVDNADADADGEQNPHVLPNVRNAYLIYAFSVNDFPLEAPAFFIHISFSSLFFLKFFCLISAH